MFLQLLFVHFSTICQLLSSDRTSHAQILSQHSNKRFFERLRVFVAGSGDRVCKMHVLAERIIRVVSVNIALVYALALQWLCLHCKGFIYIERAFALQGLHLHFNLSFAMQTFHKHFKDFTYMARISEKFQRLHLHGKRFIFVRVGAS